MCEGRTTRYWEVDVLILRYGDDGAAARRVSAASKGIRIATTNETKEV